MKPTQVKLSLEVLDWYAMTNDDRKILTDVRALIANEANWTQLALARDSMGIACHPRDPQATQWCLGGAFRKIGEDPEIRNANTYLGRASGVKNWYGISGFNDSHTHVQVLTLIDKALEASP